MTGLLLLLGACDGKGDRAPTDDTAPPDDTAVDSAIDDTAPENHPPAAPIPTIEEADDGTLSCVVETPLDPDGEAVTLTRAWTSESGFTSAEADVSPADAARAAHWTCTVTAADPTGTTSVNTATWDASGPVPRQYAFLSRMALPYGVDMVALPDDTLLIATLAGELVRVDPVSRETLGSVVVADFEEELLSLAIDPSTATESSVQAYYWTSQTCRLGRVDLDLATLTVTDETDVLTLDCNTEGGHSSGDLLFWQGETDTPALYFTLGPLIDIHPQDDTDVSEGVFAWFVDPDTAALTPALDPVFTDPAGVAIGLRNPWRMIDCGPGLCIGDPGAGSFEELDLYTGPGMNFGAGEVEGPDPDGVYTDPTRYWDHDDPAFVEDDHDGGGELRFVKVPMLGLRVSDRGYSGRLADVVLYGDFYDGWIRGFRIDDDGTIGDDVPIAHRRHIMAMAETSDGVVWAIELGGTLQELVLRGDRPVIGEAGSLLSDTTFFDGGTSFDVRYPLWSNGADKERMVQLPAGETITVGDTWTWPVGAKLWKTFSMDGERVETRLLEKTAEGWVAGVYLWDGDDAVLTDGTRQELLLSGGGYTVPSTETCAFCHASSPDREWPIGPQPFQLGEEGLAAFAPLLSGDPGPVPEVAGETDPLAIDVRGALHGNCAYCHDENGLAATISETRIDLSYDAETTGLINARVNYYDDLTPYGAAQEWLVIPGEPDESVLLDILDATDMPPVGVWREDTELTDAVELWIDRL
jgi:hypothetical protein